MKQPFDIAPEISRVLARGGRIYVEAPNWTSLFVPSFGFYRRQKGPLNFYDDPTHLKPWSEQGIFNFIHQGCRLKVTKAGVVRNIPKLLFNPFILILELLTGKRSYVLSAIWNIVGWAVFAIGYKE